MKRLLNHEINLPSRSFVWMLVLSVGAINLLMSTSLLAAAEKKKETKEAKAPSAAPAPAAAEPAGLSPREAGEGWIMLFDGQTPFGWDLKTAGTIGPGKMELKGLGTIATTTSFGDFELVIEALATKGKEAELVLNGEPFKFSPKKKLSRMEWRVESKGGKHTVKTGKLLGGASTQDGASHTPITIRIPEGTELEIHAINLRPLGLDSIFNGKDLTGWKPLEGGNRKSVFTVNKEGELNIKNGPGDLHSTGEYQDFILQLDVISNGEHLNSGVFFRSIPDQFWQGYEAQIRNEWQGYTKDKKEAEKPRDRTKPIDIGTGGIYSRQASRKVVSNDHEWFTYTITADGPHIALWVNGYQTADYVDNEPDGANARDGHRFLKKGNITLQGHNGPGREYGQTDLSFRKIRIVELPTAPTKTEK